MLVDLFDCWLPWLRLVFLSSACVSACPGFFQSKSSLLFPLLSPIVSGSWRVRDWVERQRQVKAKEKTRKRQNGRWCWRSWQLEGGSRGVLRQKWEREKDAKMEMVSEIRDEVRREAKRISKKEICLTKRERKGKREDGSREERIRGKDKTRTRSARTQ